MVFVAVLLQCGAQAASVGPRRNINATTSLLTFDRISPFLSEQAAELLLQYKNGSLFLPYQLEDGWTMQQICDRNDNDRPHPNNAHYREILEDFETEVLDHQDKKNVQQFFNTVFNDAIVPLFDPKQPEIMKVDRTDPFFVFRFLQSV